MTNCKKQIAPRTARPQTLFLSLLSSRDAMWRENCQISQTRCSHERLNFQSRTKVVYHIPTIPKFPGKYVVSFHHHNAMCLSWACKTNRVIEGVRAEHPMCWMSGWCQGQDNDVFVAHSITIRHREDRITHGRYLMEPFSLPFLSWSEYEIVRDCADDVQGVPYKPSLVFKSLITLASLEATIGTNSGSSERLSAFLSEQESLDYVQAKLP